jgi:YegS/Rv2252/BmrU family lipid kinase
MKCLFLYSKAPGRGNVFKHLDYIKRRLNNIYQEVKIIEAKNLAELHYYAKESANNYDVLVFSGGDGTFHHIINAIAPLKKRPILGYLPSGTLNDFGRNFGFSRSLKKSLNTLEKQKVVSFDLGVVNEQYYFSFLLANGAFSNISYSTKRNRVRLFGKLSYYFKAVFAALKKQKYDIAVKIDNQIITKKVPFVLLLNGKYAGGFKIDKTNLYNDGYLQLFLPRVSFLNGLFDFFFTRHKLVSYKVNKLAIEGTFISSWCLDGEEIVLDKVEITTLNEHIRIFSN